MGLVGIHPTLILASGSPRRDQMLSKAGFVFEIVPSRVAEIARPGEDPRDMAVRLGLDKAREVSGRVGPDRVVLGVDTVVAVGQHTLGKPADEAEAIRMLLLLSGRTHLVYSGYALVGRGFEQTGLERTRVTMRSISQEEAEAYSATGEPLDKAGGYGIQGEAIKFITAVDGSRSNVAGLPIEALVPRLASWDINPERIDGDAPGRKDP
jgi:septum formation protein